MHAWTMSIFLNHADFLVKLDEHNEHMPENMWLLCGDSRLGESQIVSVHGWMYTLLPDACPFVSFSDIPTTPFCVQYCINADDLTTTIANAMHQPVTAFGDPFKVTLSRLRFFFEQVLGETEWAGKEVMVFIDSNPAFTEYTQLALCE